MIADVLEQALVITGFVIVMMVVVEYVNVLTRGRTERFAARSRAGHSLIGAFLGVTPGCLGAFAAGSMYAHRALTLGGLVATMIATSGDESFVMLAMFPGRAFTLFAVLFVTGVLSGMVVDAVLKWRRTAPNVHLRNYHAVHAGDQHCTPGSRRELREQWRHCSPQRGWLTIGLALFAVSILLGRVGHHHDAHAPEHHDHARIEAQAHGEPSMDTPAHSEGEPHLPSWDWVRVTLLLTSLVGLFIVATVPDHFLEEHLWNHIVRVHAWRILLWTLGALLVTELLVAHLPMDELVRHSRLPVLLVACLVGLIPQSGPHLIFVTLYAEGAIPFSILLASSIVQDGHGMIPVLAHSRRAFFAVKAINLVVGLGVGLACEALGWFA